MKGVKPVSVYVFKEQVKQTPIRNKITIAGAAVSDFWCSLFYDFWKTIFFKKKHLDEEWPLGRKLCFLYVREIFSIFFAVPGTWLQTNS